MHGEYPLYSRIHFFTWFLLQVVVTRSLLLPSKSFPYPIYQIEISSPQCKHPSTIEKEMRVTTSPWLDYNRRKMKISFSRLFLEVFLFFGWDGRKMKKRLVWNSNVIKPRLFVLRWKWLRAFPFSRFLMKWMDKRFDASLLLPASARLASSHFHLLGWLSLQNIKSYRTEVKHKKTK